LLTAFAARSMARTMHSASSMSVKQALELAAVAALAATAAPTSAGPAPSFMLIDKPGNVTEATLTIDASPAEVYALVTDYANWTRVLPSDVRSVKVERPGRETARVHFTSASFGRAVTVQFANEANHILRFKGVKGPPGGVAAGTYRLEPMNGGQRTKVTATLYLDIKGPAALFVSDAKIKRMRHAKLQADLSDVLRAFPHREIDWPQA
jgi:carbon monoxide dehydrogenase subunit G